MVHLRTRWRTAILVGCIAVGSLLLSACGSGGSSTSSTGGEATGNTGNGGNSGNAENAAAENGGGQYTIGISNPIGSNPTLKVWQEGIELQAKALGMKTVAADANYEPNKQLSDVESLAAGGIDALVLTPLDTEAIRPALEKVAGEGVVVIGYDGGEGPYSANFKEAAYEGGKDAALALAKAVGKGAKIGIIEGVPQVPNLAERNEGMKDGAEEAGLEVVANEVNLKDNASAAQPIVEGWRSKFGSELAGVVAYNDPSALGAAATSNGSSPLAVVGMNASPEGIEGIEDGQLLASFNQRPVEVGNGLAYAAKEAIEGKELAKEIVVELPEYNKANVDTWKSPQELLQGPLKVEFVEKSGKTVLETKQK